MTAIGMAKPRFVHKVETSINAIMPVACRCIKLAIVHDVAEGRHASQWNNSLALCVFTYKPLTLHCVAAIVGDIAPSDNVTKEVKNQLETEAMHKIRHMLGADSAAGEHV